MTRSNGPESTLSFAYVDEKESKITTWTGETLGNVVFWGLLWRSNFGDRRIPIRVKGINGLMYWGVYYYDAGDYCRLRKMKG